MSILGAGVVIGFALNLMGWLGNVFLLGPMWQRAFVGATSTDWRDSPWRDLFSLLPDFIYGITVCWLYVALIPRYGASLTTALRASALIAMVGVVTTYFGIANSGLLPWSISAATTLLALVTFVPGAWLVDRLLRPSAQP